jgi:hypothetical protein
MSSPSTTLERLTWHSSVPPPRPKAPATVATKEEEEEEEDPAAASTAAAAAAAVAAAAASEAAGAAAEKCRETLMMSIMTVTPTAICEICMTVMSGAKPDSRLRNASTAASARALAPSSVN